MAAASSASNCAYDDLTRRVAALASNNEVQAKLKARGLRANLVSWEDTSRYQNSCWGSNITDVTLKVGSSRMPMIRSENFTDVTVDLTSDKLPKLVVGNESGTGLTKITLKEYLENFQKYCGVASAGRMNLHDKRDDHILTSVQACVLPTENSKVEFAVDAYNYQSRTEPAVLVVMATSYGTSAQVVCGGNTLLHFNNNGTSCMFKAERLTDYRISQGRPADGPMTSEEKALNGIYIFQIPLKCTPSPRYLNEVLCCASAQKCMSYDCEDDCDDGLADMTFCYKDSSNSKPKTRSMNARGMERAILTVGSECGRYKGICNDSGTPHKIERDTDKPIRLTVQFYLCSDTENISDANIDDICSQVRHIYEQGLNEGSLVVEGVSTKPGAAASAATAARPTASTPSKQPAHLNNSIL